MTRKILIFTILLAIPGVLEAKSGVGTFIKSLGTLIDSMTVRGVDRRYIEAPPQPWQVIAKGNINQTYLRLKSSIDGAALFSDLQGKLYWEPCIKTDPSTYAGFWVGYRGYGLGYSWNVGGDNGRIFTLGATGGSYGINLRIHNFINDEPEVRYSGRFTIDGITTPEPIEISGTEYGHMESPIKARAMMLDGYYLFNGSRFSYAAAYDQSVIQKRSAGSFMAGIMYYHAHVDYVHDDNADFILLMDNIGRIKQWQLNIGAGYAYNFVPCKGLLISAMVMPMITVYNHHKTWRYDSNLRQMAIDDVEHDYDELEDVVWQLSPEPMSVSNHHGKASLNFDGRLSMTYQWGAFFVNAYGQFNNFQYKDENVNGYLNDWYVNAAVGVRF